MFSTLHHHQEYKKKGKKQATKFSPIMMAIYYYWHSSRDFELHPRTSQLSQHLSHLPCLWAQVFCPKQFHTFSEPQAISTTPSCYHQWSWRILYARYNGLTKAQQRFPIPCALDRLQTQTQSMAFWICTPRLHCAGPLDGCRSGSIVATQLLFPTGFFNTTWSCTFLSWCWFPPHFPHLFFF